MEETKRMERLVGGVERWRIGHPPTAPISFKRTTRLAGRRSGPGLSPVTDVQGWLDRRSL